MHILFLQIFFPDLADPGQSNLYSDLVLHFAAQGHSVHVATLLEARCGCDTYRESVRGIETLHVRCGNLFNVGRLTKLRTLLSLPGRFGRALREHWPDEHFDLVLYPTPPITFAPVVKKLKQQSGCGTYLILRDIFPQNARDLGMIHDPLTFRYFRRKERQLYDLSDRIGCMSQGNIDYLLAHNRGLDPAKLEILYNWETVPADLPVDRDIVRREFDLEGKFVVVFGGNLGPAQELPFLLELARIYRNINDVLFLIVGQGTARPLVEKIIARNQLANVRLLDPMPRAAFNRLLAGCDVGLINLDHRFTIPNIPSKTLAYFAAGLPVLAAIDHHTDFGRLLDECGAGLWSITGNLPAYQANFERLRNDVELRHRLGENGRRALAERFSVERAYDTIMRTQPPVPASA